MTAREHDLNLIAALVEGRLDHAEKAQVLEHLADCAECRATLATLARGGNEGLLAPVAAGSPRPRWSSPARWVAIAASVAVAAIALRLTMSPDSVPSGDPGSSGPVVDESLLPTRAAGRIVDGKTFRVKGGEWVDAAFDAGAAPVIVIQGRQARDELLARMPQLRPFTELGDRVVVVHDGIAYRFEP